MCTMSLTESSCTTSNATEKLCVGESTEDCKDDSADKNTNCVSNGCSSQDRGVRERVLKEVGITSTAFIGPAFPPQTAPVKSDIDDSLSEFYKELERIDTPDGANGNPGKQDTGFVQQRRPPNKSTSKETQDVPGEKIVNTRNSEGTQSSWPHWYQNEPYYSRRQRPGPELSSANAVSNQWHYPPPPLNRPPNPRFHRPPFPHRPPLSAFPNPQIPPPPMNPTSNHPGLTNQYQDESHFPTFPRFPPPNVASHPSRDFRGDLPHHLDRDYRDFSYTPHSDNLNRMSSDRNGEWSQLDQDFEPENDVWERRHHCDPCDDRHAYPSSLVLILMRGLPGSGKSTLAKELLSTGPSGIILSTDDYFAQKNDYRYDPGLLGAAHEWNQSRAKDALHDGCSPIIIDNTNLQAWEMKPYVRMALERGYKVEFCEPDTRWKFDPYELEKRNKQGVPQEKIAQMLDRFSFPISVDIVMNSPDPPHVSQRRRPNDFTAR
ncbi:NEDD4-binding protein 2-like 2 [Mugil cephalus]|uniref:NEDD4-binding protein 2-like 2 n=1 Tax=Mugil cephalus TaxID=48193 RepID=UPI001FB7CB3C|nr:NEDD4-binding protein 2-like 2 [Mugil cephalus]